MKKTLLLSSICLATLLAGCTKPPVQTQPEPTIQSGSAFSLESKYTYNRDMKIPSVKELTNFDSITNGYKEIKKVSHTITQDDITNNQECKDGIDIVANGMDDEHILKTIPYNNLKLNNKIDVSVSYTGAGLGLKFSSGQLTALNTQGWMIMEANSTMLEKIVGNNNYDPNTIEQDSPEWANSIDMIGGSASPQERYPYNTVYVSSDLLLHAYHKLFGNSLKEYEMTTARLTIEKTIDDSLATFSKLSQSASPQLKPYYEYLTAYRSIAKILLPSNQEMTALLESPKDITEYTQREKNMNNGEFKPEYLKSIILTRAKTILTQYPTQYNTAVNQSIIDILDGEETKKVDSLSQAFSPQTDPEFLITQDYTQFVARSHYTDNSYLKTYFMTMKWLMRHKMYARDPKSTQASLIMAKNFPTSATEGLEKLQNFVQKMIGADDDITIKDLQQFIQSKKIDSDTNIVAQYTTGRADEISKLRPQKISSTSYITPSENATTEDKAKANTNGFVFFGEKFTPDSWIMDQLTAGSAEKESEIKPPVVSVYQIRDTIMGGTRSTYAINRFKQHATQFDITQKHIDNYASIKTETQQGLSGNTDNSTIYNKWIQLSKIATVKPKNAPAYMKNEKFIDKILNTILGTYTELKHDTLLYVKQAYAELGAGGNGCMIAIDVPALPIPKGYVEPQIDLIDQLSQLSQETSTFFGETNKENFTIFNDYLAFVKTIAIAQTENKVIADEDFEKLRLSYDILRQVMSPSNTYVNHGEKGMRASLIADIFTSGAFGPYYIATGRPLLMVVSIDDANGKRAAIGPVYSTYEFYGNPFQSAAGRYTDQDRRTAYDTLTGKKELMTLPLQNILSQ